MYNAIKNLKKQYNIHTTQTSLIHAWRKDDTVTRIHVQY